MIMIVEYFHVDPHLNEHSTDKRLSTPLPLSNCVVQPGGRREAESTVKANNAIEEEWRRLRARNAWDESQPREWTDVTREARWKRTKVPMGMVVGFVAENIGSQRERRTSDTQGTRRFPGTWLLTRNHGDHSLMLIASCNITKSSNRTQCRDTSGPHYENAKHG